MSKSHNLDIHMYSLKEIFDLFDIDYSKQITMEQIKQAKRKVLMTHPDKSRLAPEYFLFYKRAFEVIAKYYTEQERQNQTVPKEPISYCPLRDQNRRTTEYISQKASQQASQKEFQKKFNELFEENMTKKIDPTKNAWFSDESKTETEKGITVANMGSAFERLKEKQASMVLYRGVEELVSGGAAAGQNLYEDEDDDFSNEPGRYVSCDPFSKLKYDDLRKVHKEQTVLAVSERDFRKVPQYSSVDHFMRERNIHSLEPLEKTAAEKLLLEKENQKREWVMRQQHAANMRTSQYETKNKEILSQFFLLGR
jgi:hypothetical protein